MNDFSNTVMDKQRLLVDACWCLVSVTFVFMSNFQNICPAEEICYRTKCRLGDHHRVLNNLRQFSESCLIKKKETECTARRSNGDECVRVPKNILIICSWRMTLEISLGISIFVRYAFAALYFETKHMWIITYCFRPILHRWTTNYLSWKAYMDDNLFALTLSPSLSDL